MWFILVPFLIQIFVIGLDETYFHLKRGLPRFERIGHPIDTLSVVICFLFIFVIPFSSTSLKWYIALAAGSCLLVTKDEFVHKKHCSGAEQWLHALLFLNHPILLFSLGVLWCLNSSETLPGWIQAFSPYKSWIQLFAKGAAGFTTLFFFYQLIFWNVIWNKDEPPLKP